MLIYVKKKKKLFTDRRTTQKYSSEPHKKVPVKYIKNTILNRIQKKISKTQSFNKYVSYKF